MRGHGSYDICALCGEEYGNHSWGEDKCPRRWFGRIAPWPFKGLLGFLGVLNFKHTRFLKRGKA